MAKNSYSHCVKTLYYNFIYYSIDCNYNIASVKFIFIMHAKDVYFEFIINNYSGTSAFKGHFEDSPDDDSDFIRNTLSN